MDKKKEFVLMENSLDVIRLFAAMQVAITHYLNLTIVQYGIHDGADSFLLWFKRTLSLFPGVVILFTISGFLMGASLEKQETRITFLRKRFLRIYPGLWVNIVLTAAVILCVVKNAFSHISSLLTWAGIQAAGLAFTPEFLKEYGAGSINGALWTIMVEIQFYLLIGLFWKFLKNRTVLWWKNITILSILMNLLCWMVKDRGMLPDSMLALLDRSFLPYLIWFSFGILIYKMRDRAVEILKKLFVVLLPCFFIYKACWLLLGWNVPGYYTDIITSLLLPCIVIGAAYRFGKHRMKLEISYGIFLYHWPLINLVFHYDLPQKGNRLLLFIGYTVLYLGLAYLSGVLVEKPCIGKFVVDRKGKD